MASKALARYVNTNGSGTQNQAGTKINIAIMIAVEMKKMIQSIPFDEVSFVLAI